MPIDLTHDTLIPFSNLPGWTTQHLGRRIHPSTLHRWRLRGVRGVRLDTVLIGGTRYTSTEALSRFFAATTAAADGQPFQSQPADTRQDDADAAFLAKHGI